MSEREAAEDTIRRAFDAGAFEEAATAILQAYGREISGFVVSRLHGRAADAQEAFSMFVEDLWIGLPNFSWRCTVRAWCYVLARNAAVRYGVSKGRRDARHRVLQSERVLAIAQDQVRTETAAYQQTAVKDRFRSLREQLDVEDQTLLILRVDKGMSWRDLALTLTGDVDLDEDAIKRESARLRKAFERVKEQLRRMAEREGLLAERD